MNHRRLSLYFGGNVPLSLPADLLGQHRVRRLDLRANELQPLSPQPHQSYSLGKHLSSFFRSGGYLSYGIESEINVIKIFGLYWLQTRYPLKVKSTSIPFVRCVITLKKSYWVGLLWTTPIWASSTTSRLCAGSVFPTPAWKVWNQHQVILISYLIPCTSGMRKQFYSYCRLFGNKHFKYLPKNLTLFFKFWNEIFASNSNSIETNVSDKCDRIWTPAFESLIFP